MNQPWIYMYSPSLSLVIHLKYIRVYESSLSIVQETLTLKCVYRERVHQKFYS